MDSNSTFYDCLRVPLSTIKLNHLYKDLNTTERYRNNPKYKNRKVELCARIFDHENEAELDCMLLSKSALRNDSNFINIPSDTVIKPPNKTKWKASKNDICTYLKKNKSFFYRHKNIEDRWIFESVLANIAFNKPPSTKNIPNDTIVENEDLCVKVFYINKDVRKHPYCSVFLDMFNQEHIIDGLCQDYVHMKDYCREGFSNKAKNFILIIKFAKIRGSKIPKPTLIGCLSMSRISIGRKRPPNYNQYIDDVCTSKITTDIRDALKTVGLENLPFGSLLLHIAFKWHLKCNKLHYLELDSTKKGLMCYIRNGFRPSRCYRDRQIICHDENAQFESIVDDDDKETRTNTLKTWFSEHYNNNIGSVRMKIYHTQIIDQIKKNDVYKNFNLLKLDFLVPNLHDE